LFEIRDRKTEEVGSHKNKVQNTYLITLHMEYKHISLSLFRQNHDVRYCRKMGTPGVYYV